MENTKVDERWWKYKITDEQIEQIKAENGEAIRRFWEDNEELICSLIKKELRRSGSFVDIWDCISQVYCDLPKYEYTCSLDISYGIFRSVRYCVSGYADRNKTVSLSLEFGEELTLEDVLIGKHDIEEFYNYSVEAERLYYKIALMLFSKSEKKQIAFLRRI